MAWLACVGEEEDSTARYRAPLQPPAPSQQPSAGLAARLAPATSRPQAPKPARVSAHLGKGGVAVKDYGSLLGDVKAMAGAGTKIWMDPARVSYALKQAALAAAAAGAGRSPAPAAAGGRKRARAANGAPAAAAAADEAGASPPSVILEKPSPGGWAVVFSCVMPARCRPL